MSEWVKAQPSAEIKTLLPSVRMWQKDVHDGRLTAMKTIELTDDEFVRVIHVSISHKGFLGQPSRYPTWDEQKEAVWKFAPGKEMASYMPPNDNTYVNVHKTTFHWWEVKNEQHVEVGDRLK